MREQVERHRPDLLELALAEVADDLFERAGEGTRWAQPAIFCAALAGWERLKDDAASPTRWPATRSARSPRSTAAGALSAEDGLRLVAARGRFMQEAAEETGDGSMMAVARATRSRAADRRGRRGRRAVAIANDNAPDQLVLSGALDRAGARRGAAQGARRARQAAAGRRRLPLAADGAGRAALPRGRRGRRDPRAGRARLLLRDRRAVRRRPEQLVAAITNPVRWTDVLRALAGARASPASSRPVRARC